MRKILSVFFSALMLAGCASSVAAEAHGLIVRFKVDEVRAPTMKALSEQHQVKLSEPRALSLGAWIYQVDGKAKQAFFIDLQKAPQLDYAEWDAVMQTQQ